MDSFLTCEVCPDVAGWVETGFDSSDCDNSDCDTNVERVSADAEVGMRAECSGGGGDGDVDGV